MPSPDLSHPPIAINSVLTGLRQEIEDLKRRISDLEKIAKWAAPVREHLRRAGLDPDMVNAEGEWPNVEIYRSETWSADKEQFTLYNIALREIGFMWQEKFEWTPGHWVRAKEAGGHE